MLFPFMVPLFRMVFSRSMIVTVTSYLGGQETCSCSLVATVQVPAKQDGLACSASSVLQAMSTVLFISDYSLRR